MHHAKVLLGLGRPIGEIMMPPKPPLPPHPGEPHGPPGHGPPGSGHEPPHERRKRFWGKRLVISVVAGTVVTFALSLILYVFQISINVILPVAAPIWVGMTSLTYSAVGDKLG